MRTTLDIDSAVLSAAKEIAGVRKVSAGRVISELALKGLRGEVAPSQAKQSGFPVFEIPADSQPLSSAEVKTLLNDEGLPAGR